MLVQPPDILRLARKLLDLTRSAIQTTLNIDDFVNIGNEFIILTSLIQDEPPSNVELDQLATALWNHAISYKLLPEYSVIVPAYLRLASAALYNLMTKRSEKLPMILIKTGQSCFDAKLYPQATLAYQQAESIVKPSTIIVHRKLYLILIVNYARLLYQTGSTSLALHQLNRINSDASLVDIALLSSQDRIALVDVCLDASKHTVDDPSGPISWQRKAVEIAPNQTVNKSQSLLLLASTYLEAASDSSSGKEQAGTSEISQLEKLELAESTVELLLAQTQATMLLTSAYFVKLKILICQSAAIHKIPPVFEAAMAHAINRGLLDPNNCTFENPMDIFVAMLHRISKYCGSSDAIYCIDEFLNEIQSKHEASLLHLPHFKNAIDRLLITKLYFLLNVHRRISTVGHDIQQEYPIDEQVVDETCELINRFSDANPTNIQSAMMIIWHAADRASHQNKHTIALKWYTVALRLLNPSSSTISDKINSASLYRKAALCHLNTGEYAKMRVAIESAQLMDANSKTSSGIDAFLSCVCIIRDSQSNLLDFERGNRVFELMSSVTDIQHDASSTIPSKLDMLVHLAQIAHEISGDVGKFVLMAVLKLIVLLDDIGNGGVFVFRCLIRVLANLQVDSFRFQICGYLEQVSNLPTVANFKCGLDEIEWIITEAWNNSVDSVRQVTAFRDGESYELSYRFWRVVAGVVDLLPRDAQVIDKLVLQLKSLFLMLTFAADSIIAGKDNSDLVSPNELALMFLKFRGLYSKIRGIDSSLVDTSLLFDSVIIELQLLIGSLDFASIPKVISFADSISAPIDTYKSLVDICVRSMCPAATIFIVVKACLDVMLRRDSEFNITLFSQWFRILIESAIASASPAGDCTAEGVIMRSPIEVNKMFQQVIAVIRNAAPEYPQDEIRFLIITAWNKGIEAYAFQDHGETKIWIELAVTLSNFDLTDSVEAAVVRRKYPEILAHISRI